MDIPVRNKETQQFITVRGNIEEAKNFLSNNPHYGITFMWAGNFGNKVLVLQVNDNILYTTEEGSLVGEYKRCTSPEQEKEILTELCNESKRRFEESTPALNQWGS